MADRSCERGCPGQGPRNARAATPQALLTRVSRGAGNERLGHGPGYSPGWRRAGRVGVAYRGGVAAAATATLVRKSDLSRAGGSSGRRVSAARSGVECGGWLAGCGQELAGFGVDGLDGDFVAEAFEAADVVAGLAAGVHALLVVVRAEVGVAGVGVGQQGVDDGEHGVAGGDQGLLLGHAPGQAPVLRAEE